MALCRTHPGVISINEIYTVEELFRRVGISARGIREARKRGLVVKRFGRKKVVRGSDIMKYLDTLPDAEGRFLVDNSSTVSVDVDAVIAPHHGADNGSSTQFVRAMSPQYVIFSAGSEWHHPRKETANRYLRNGVIARNIFRTDRGDNEGDPEWRPRSGAGSDPAGDDDIDVVLKRNGNIEVAYRPRTHRWNAPFALRAPNAALATEDSTDVSPLPPEILAYVADDSLWTETEDDLEIHTVQPHVQAKPSNGAIASGCHQPFSGFHRYAYGCGCRPLYSGRCCDD